MEKGKNRYHVQSHYWEQNIPEWIEVYLPVFSTAVLWARVGNAILCFHTVLDNDKQDLSLSGGL